VEEERDRLRLVGGPCSTCGGSPHPSGKVCVCGGKNTQMDESDGLRHMVYDEMKRVEVAEQRLAAARAEAVRGFAEWLDGKDGSETIWALPLAARFLASRKEPTDG
jgi:hypothetical protein